MKSGHTRRQWEGKFFLCGCKCIYCETPLTLDSATKDHLIPLSRGGSDEIYNIAPACFHCNVVKNSRTFEEFMRERPGFCTKAMNSTVIGKPMEQARALLSINPPVEKPKPVESTPARTITLRRIEPLRMSLAARDEPSLTALRRESETISWAWRNPA